MKVKDIIKLIENDGWELKRIRASHGEYKHKKKKGLVTIPGHLNEEMAIGRVKSIFKGAGLNNE